MRKIALAAASSMLALLSVTPLSAQTLPLDKRVDRIEKELKAVQRKVFPGGAPIEPTVTAPQAPTVVPGTPASTPLSDLLSRVDALESQLTMLTGQVEQNTYKLKQLQEDFANYKAAHETPEPADAADAGASSPALAAAPAPAPAKPTPAPAAPKPAAAAPKPAAAAPAASDARKTAVAAVEKPDTGDAAGDSYTYGFRLWDAKFYPEAEAQLKSTVDKYGTTPIGSRAANLLGRAYLDDGKPSTAATTFYENYKKRPDGDRAADSLAYLGEALIQLKRPQDACTAYAELEQAFGAELKADLKAMMDKGRTRAKCG